MRLVAANGEHETLRRKGYRGLFHGRDEVQPTASASGDSMGKTETKARETDPLLPSEVRAAGFAVDATGRATTVAGIDYQYFSRSQVWRGGDYDSFFPSIAVKYPLRERLIAHVGYNKAISRPPVNALAGVWTINETDQIVNLPNPNLRPEQSDNYAARLSYYFEPAGNLAVGVFQNDISDLRELRDLTADQFGYGDDPPFGTYTFRTQENGVRERRFRGMEIEYGQHLSFLPGILRGLNVSGSYVCNYSDLRRPGLVPHRVNGGVGFRPCTGIGSFFAFVCHAVA